MNTWTDVTVGCQVTEPNFLQNRDVVGDEVLCELA
jgi:hypothetical protein